MTAPWKWRQAQTLHGSAIVFIETRQSRDLPPTTTRSWSTSACGYWRQVAPGFLFHVSRIAATSADMRGHSASGTLIPVT